MISDTQTRYGVGSCCHGRCLRPAASNQLNRREAIGIVLGCGLWAVGDCAARRCAHTSMALCLSHCYLSIYLGALARASTPRNTSSAACSIALNIQRRPTTAGIQKPGVTLERYVMRVRAAFAGSSVVCVSPKRTSLRAGSVTA